MNVLNEVRLAARQRERRACKRTLVTLVKGTTGEWRIGDDATRLFRALSPTRDTHGFQLAALIVTRARSLSS